MTTVEVQPATVAPISFATSAYPSSSTAARKPPRPNQVASLRGAREKPVRLSTDSRTILATGYFDLPAALTPRTYPTVADGKAREGTTSRSTRCASGSAFTASTVARDISR
jgi:hypothetical protein